MFKVDDEVRTQCETLTVENKKYVIAVAQALNFSQQQVKGKRKEVSKGKGSKRLAKTRPA